MPELPIVFQDTGPQQIASYNYEDLATGLGISTFYGMELSGSYVLTQNSSAASTTAWFAPSTNAFSQTFQSGPFNVTRTMKGHIIVNVPIGRDIGNAGNNLFGLGIYHWDGTTSTQLGVSGAYTSATNSAAILPTESQYAGFDIDIGEKLFKKGEMLRIKLTRNTDDNKAYIGYDPINRSPGAVMVNSRMSVFVPFRIDN
jgi:hypothetical protein